MNTTLIKDMIQKSMNAQITFPQIVMGLLEEGIEAYHVDMVTSENRYYKASGEFHVEKIDYKYPVAAKSFSASEVSAAIKKVQLGQSNYKKFVQEIMDAGCVYYIAYLAGKRVIYFGREGDFHVEHFPKN